MYSTCSYLEGIKPCSECGHRHIDLLSMATTHQQLQRERLARLDHLEGRGHTLSEMVAHPHPDEDYTPVGLDDFEF